MGCRNTSIEKHEYNRESIETDGKRDTTYHKIRGISP